MARRPKPQAGSALQNAMMAPVLVLVVGLTAEFGWYGLQEQRLSRSVEAAQAIATQAEDPAAAFETALDQQLAERGLEELNGFVLAYVEGGQLQANVALDYPGLTGFAPVPKVLERTVRTPIGG